jgi:stress response protein YsnF
MLTDRELSAAVGGTAYGPDGEAIGTVRHFLADDRTGTPTWAVLSTDASRPAVVPVLDAVWTGDALRLPVTRAAAEDAPTVTSVEHLDPGDEDGLRRHYGMVKEGMVKEGIVKEDMVKEGPATEGGRDREGLDRDESGATGGAGAATDSAMTRSEERLRVRMEQVPTTRVRLVKYVVTEEVQVTVPVRREEVRLEEVPLDAPDPGPGESLAPDEEPLRSDAAPAGGLPDEIVLHREEPVVSVRVVPAERVRLRTDVVQGQEQVAGRLQREQIVLDQDATR